jgi:hypothetical protein
MTLTMPIGKGWRAKGGGEKGGIAPNTAQRQNRELKFPLCLHVLYTISVAHKPANGPERKSNLYQPRTETTLEANHT